MKPWKQILLGICTMAVATMGFFLPAFAETCEQSNTVYLYDQGDLLTNDAFQTALETLEKTAEQTDMHIGVWLGSTAMGENTTETRCEDTFDDTFGVAVDGIFLYLDCSDDYDLYDYIYTSGNGQFYYNNAQNYDRISAIWSDLDPYLTRGSEDLSGAIEMFCQDLVYYADNNTISERYYAYDAYSETYLFLEDGVIISRDVLPLVYRFQNITLEYVWICALIGLVIGFLLFLFIRIRYRFKTAETIQRYLQSGEVRFVLREDRFVRKYRTRTRIQQNNGGGGYGGGGHHGGGGHSHGGGGGHHR